MTKHSDETSITTTASAHFDVLIVGAGISGIGAAYHLRRDCPDMRFAVLDSLDSYGGTWLIHRYPGVRSDSDLFTFGYRFKPWTGNPIASREQILSYLGEVIDENALGPHIRYGHTIKTAAWSSEDNQWTIEAVIKGSQRPVRFTARFLWMCQGYYRHAAGYTPQWPDMSLYKGLFVHPQNWPEQLDYDNKRVLVIGSGATAATLVPALAQGARHVTMLQRTPTFFSTGRNADTLADELRKLNIDDTWIHEIVRRKVVNDRAELIRRAQMEPEALRRQLVSNVRQHLPEGFDVDKHFNPPYQPMQQRIAFVPDGDLFRAVSEGKASVVTDAIERFTESGVQLQSGATIDADIVITATGFNVTLLGDIDFSIDGRPLNLADEVTYRGMMFTHVPNLVWIYGYNVYSWTLRSDLIAEFVCRLLQHMQQKGACRVTPTLRAEDTDMPIEPWVNPGRFSPGYLMRSRHLFPKRGSKAEWQHTQNYMVESKELPDVDLDDPLFQYA